jgi:glycosyltransferase involved in cell wall biosynthesis
VRLLLVADVSIDGCRGGSERMLREEAVRLAARGHSVRVLTRRLDRHQTNEETIEGVREYRYAVDPGHPALFLTSTLRGAHTLMERLVREEPVDLIHAHQPFTGSVVLAAGGNTARPRALYTCHSLAYEEYLTRDPHPNPFVRWLHAMGRKRIERIALERADLVVTLSEFMRERVREKHGIPNQKIRIIPGAVDHERFRPMADKSFVRAALGWPKGRFILLTIRNLVPRMGLDRLIEAMGRIAPDLPELHLVIGGEGPLRGELEAQVKARYLDGQVRFAGYVPETELAKYYQAADLFILPTRCLEGFGLVTIEALSAGLPVLGTPVGATPEILRPLDPRLLFDSAEADAMAALILEHHRAARRDPDQLAELGRRCRRYVEERYTWERHIDRLEASYRELFGRTPGWPATSS